jgi:proline-specific peptidase
MDKEIASMEGFISFRGYNVWYRIVGEGEETGKFPLLCLHGGPGLPHDVLTPLGATATTGRRVIFYDQLGCGNSDQPQDPSLWTVDLFVEELCVVREALGLDRCHLFGHSWGGMLAMEYALTVPVGLVSLVLASSLASLPQYVAEANRLRGELPADVQQTLAQHEEAGTMDDPAYGAAWMAFVGRHFCRLDPFPEPFVLMLQKSAQSTEVQNTMFGGTVFDPKGTLKEWTIVDRLGEIKVPTLITSGRYDVASPAVARTLHENIPNSEWVLFEGSSHTAHLEETERYLQVLSEFLSPVEAQA